MSEIKPTMENLMDPYVLQLIEALGRRDDEIEHLKDIEKRQWGLRESLDDMLKENERLQAKVEALECVRAAAEREQAALKGKLPPGEVIVARNDLCKALAATEQEKQE